MKVCYSIPVLLLIVFWMLHYCRRVGDELVHIVEMSEREGSFLLI